MFSLGTLFRRGRLSIPEAPVESFGSWAMGRDRAQAILRATPFRRNCLQAIRTGLVSLSLSEKEGLVDRVLGRLAVHVFDLPAPERPEGLRRFGRLDQLLGRASEAVRRLSGPAFRISSEPSIQYREAPSWILAGMIAAVAMDLGRVYHLEVGGVRGLDRWFPCEEPLAQWCEREGVLETAEGLWRVSREGAQVVPAWGMRILQSQVLFPQLEAYLGGRLGAILGVLRGERAPGSSGREGELARRAVGLLREEESCPGGGRERRSPVPDPAAGTLPIPPDRAPAWTEPDGSPGSFREGVPAPDPAALPRTPSGAEATSGSLSPDVLDEEIPARGQTGGDPVERSRKLEVELHPVRFLDRIRRMILSGRLPRNGREGEVFLGHDVVWLVTPFAFRRIARINHLPYDREVVDRMFSSLGDHPQVVPWSRREVPFVIHPVPGAPAVHAVKIRREGFLSREELDRLGVHPVEIRERAPSRLAEVAG
jgi:hypothetical protein